MIKTFDEIIKASRIRGTKTIVVAVAQDAEVLTAVSEARNREIAEAILIGDEGKIRDIASRYDIDIDGFKIIDEKDNKEACIKAVAIARDGKADVIVKGMVDTSVILKAVLSEQSLRGDNILSHIAVAEVQGYDRLFIISDAGMNIAPDLSHKAQIIENAVGLAKALDINNPKVAVVCAVEKVNPKMPATLDAVELTKMNEKGLIANCVVGGPFALDNSVSPEAARHKGIEHPVAGNADILIVPSIEAGNILYKSLVYFARGKCAGLVVGAKIPIVVTSRADDEEAKLNSIALAVLMSYR